MGIENELIKYSKEQFHNDINLWIDKQVNFLLTENWREDNYFVAVIESCNCRTREDCFSIWKPHFSLELYDEDYEVYIEKDFDATIFEFPIYYIFIKDKNNEIDLNGNSITIEII